MDKITVISKTLKEPKWLLCPSRVEGGAIILPESFLLRVWKYINPRPYLLAILFTLFTPGIAMWCWEGCRIVYEPFTYYTITGFFTIEMGPLVLISSLPWILGKFLLMILLFWLLRKYFTTDRVFYIAAACLAVVYLASFFLIVSLFQIHAMTHVLPPGLMGFFLGLKYTLFRPY